MNKIKPPLSIGIPVYNGENFLAAAIDSLLGQTFGDFELIIADNASSDSTGEIAMAYAARDDRIRYVRNATNIGAARNFNLLVNLAGGEYFKWAAHDDICAPTLLERSIGAMREKPEILLSYSRTGHIDEHGRSLGEYNHIMRVDSPHPHVRFHDLITVEHSCMSVFGVFRTDALRRTPMMGRYSGADRNLLAEMGLWGPFHKIPECLFFQRLHGRQSIRVQERQRIAWFDPHLSGRISVPTVRTISEYGASVLRVRLPVCTRARCFRSIAELTWRWRRRVLADMQAASRDYGVRRGWVRSKPLRWNNNVLEAQAQIAQVIPPGETFLLVDQEELNCGGMLAGRRALPFLERNGRYWGAPPDDQRGLEELRRMRQMGANFIAFAWSSFWWLDYYSDLRQYLRNNARQVLKSNVLIVFDLRGCDNR